MKQAPKDRLTGIVGATAFHLILVLILVFAYLETPSTRNIAEWSGVPVMFGNVADAYGDSEPFGGGGTVSDRLIEPNSAEASLPDETIAPSNIDGAEAPIATQNLEQTIAIDEATNKAREETHKKNLEDQKLIAERVKQDEKRRADEARIAQQKASEAAQARKIEEQMKGSFGKGSGDTGSRGNTHGEGTQGVPTGNASHGKTSGIGGWGSFDLGGRSLGTGGLIRPSYSVNDYGTVVVDVVVNAKGQVLEASIGRGTNTPSAVLKQEAISAARRTRFNEVTSVGNQKGTITYKFNLN